MLKKIIAQSNKDNRAIGGFSRGGGQTLRTAFGNMDKFSWICCYSAYCHTAGNGKQLSNLLLTTRKIPTSN